MKTTYQKKIRKTILNVTIKQTCSQNLEIFKPIAIALTQVESNKCKISDSVRKWKVLQKYLEKKLSSEQLQKFNQRYKMALKPCHFAAFLLCPSNFFDWIDLSQEEAMKL